MDEPLHPERLDATRDHRRQWRDCLYVYPVIARRSKGLSIGVNLNPDKRCNFACVYCQVDRRASRNFAVDMGILRSELRLALLEAINGGLWDEPMFAAVPQELRRVNDIAFSGDGEPTCLSNFDQAVQTAAMAKDEFGRKDIKLVVITNATRLDSPTFRRSLSVLDAANGEIWAKLDAGTDEFFQRINRPYPVVTLKHILENIRDVARGRAIVIQSLFLRLDGQVPPPREIDAYAANLRDIMQSGGQIRLVQVHTIARPPSCPTAGALRNEEVDAIVARVRELAPGVAVEAYYGADVPPIKSCSTLPQP